MLKVLWDLEEAVALYDVYFQNGRRLDIANEKLQELHQMYQRRAQILGIKQMRNIAIWQDCGCS